MPEFIPGLKLSEWFYHETVAPILARQFPALQYSAALIGSGSEVLGFDTPMSSDHHWGPRLLLFLSEADYPHLSSEIAEALRHNLPYTFRGYSTNFTPPNAEDNGTRLMQPIESGPVNPMIECFTIRDFFAAALNIDPYSPLEAADWLTFPSQRLRALTAGGVFRDDLSLSRIREKLAFYPLDVWLYLLMAGWTRIAQEEAFVGRTGSVEDDLGSGVIAARLVRDIMRLCFLIEREYAPYPKWFGTAFARLKCAPRLLPILRAVNLSANWQTRETHLSQAYSILAEMHNELKITETLPTEVSPYWGRPFQVIHADRFADTIRTTIRDEAVKRISCSIGSIDQFSDSTDLLDNVALRQRLKALYA